eukprot:Seg2408.2 transcript_id=Seg2408.2/GoldUCD/mRNA.D3Y31 product="hypothetical protein" protein_id=Seg2408.2/GoldUCD/D3Y31
MRRQLCEGCGQSFTKKYLKNHLETFYDAASNVYQCSSSAKGNTSSESDCAPDDFSSDNEPSMPMSGGEDFDHSSGIEHEENRRSIPNLNESDKRAFFDTPDEDGNESSEDEGQQHEDLWINDEEIAEVERDLESGAQEIENEENDSFSDIIVRWLCLFIALWQSTNTISDTAIESLLKFLGSFLFVLASKCSFLDPEVVNFPRTISALMTRLGLKKSTFIKFTVCPDCFKLYKTENCFYKVRNILYPRKCTFVAFPNHRQRHLRKECGAELLRRVKTPSGRESLVPFKTYCYKPLRESLGTLLMRKDFLPLCQKWRERQLPEDVLEDVYDGQVWKDFKHFFDESPRNLGAMLNLDWFNPYKHAAYSVGVIYLVWLNLPRVSRFRRKNVTLIGIIPNMRHEPSTNTFLQPLVNELNEAWKDGFMLPSHGSAGRLNLFKVALMCVGCDIPACRKLCGFLGKLIFIDYFH